MNEITSFTPNIDNHNKYEKVFDLFINKEISIEEFWRRRESITNL